MNSPTPLDSAESAVTITLRRAARTAREDHSAAARRLERTLADLTVTTTSLVDHEELIGSHAAAAWTGRAWNHIADHANRLYRQAERTAAPGYAGWFDAWIAAARTWCRDPAPAPAAGTPLGDAIGLYETRARTELLIQVGQMMAPLDGAGVAAGTDGGGQ